VTTQESNTSRLLAYFPNRPLVDLKQRNPSTSLSANRLESVSTATSTTKHVRPSSDRSVLPPISHDQSRGTSVPHSCGLSSANRGHEWRKSAVRCAVCDVSGRCDEYWVGASVCPKLRDPRSVVHDLYVWVCGFVLLRWCAGG
jgi:hypothetical protein